MNNTYWDYEDKVERCDFCNSRIHSSLGCGCVKKEKIDEDNYSDRLTEGFNLSNMED